MPSGLLESIHHNPFLMSHIEMTKPIRVMVLATGDQRTPSTRYRFLKLVSDLASLGVEIVPVIFSVTKTGTLVTYLRCILNAPGYDILLIQKRLVPTLFLKALRHRSRVLVFDFDDALHVDQNDPQNPSEKIERLKQILMACDGIIAGCESLAEMASLYSKNVHLVPTGVDTKSWNPNVLMPHSGIVLGWVGTKKNLTYLEDILPVLLNLLAHNPRVRLRVVCDSPLEVVHDRVEFVEWSIGGELEAVSVFDIGLMPLADNSWTQGKCGFKALQMMSLGIPVVLSPVGVNLGFIRELGPAFGAISSQDWYEMLTRLILDEKFRVIAGSASRDFVTRNYDISVTSKMLANVLRKLIRGKDA